MSEKVNFSLTPSLEISVLLASRNRPEICHKSIKGMFERADDPDNIEFLIAIDDDDKASEEYFVETMLPWAEEAGVNLQVHSVPRWGYAQLNMYYNYLAVRASGRWMIVWNDDARIESDGWDSAITEYNGQFVLQRFKDNHNEHPYAIFPIISRDWVILFGELCPFQQIDAWHSQIMYMADAVVRNTGVCTHDRHDLTGNNDDDTYKERVYFEGNPDDPRDLNHPTRHMQKFQQLNKVVWLRKLLGQDTGYWDSVERGERDAWEKMKEHDPNDQIGVSKVRKE